MIVCLVTQVFRYWINSAYKRNLYYEWSSHNHHFNDGTKHVSDSAQQLYKWLGSISFCKINSSMGSAISRSLFTTTFPYISKLSIIYQFDLYIAFLLFQWCVHLIIGISIIVHRKQFTFYDYILIVHIRTSCFWRCHNEDRSSIAKIDV